MSFSARRSWPKCCRKHWAVYRCCETVEAANPRASQRWFTYSSTKTEIGEVALAVGGLPIIRPFAAKYRLSACTVPAPEGWVLMSALQHTSQTLQVRSATCRI